jgi:uncharacterized small protein (TIGR04563 family)
MASMSSQKKKVTLYFNAGMLAETQKEALRQDRSVSWIIQAAWRIAREEVRQTPGALTTPAAVPAELEDSATPPPVPLPRPVSRV